jgi:hypothetical protein
MKNLILIFSVLLSTSLSAVEYGFITNATADDFTDRVILNSGDFLDILGLSPKDNNYSYLLVASLDADIDNLDNSAEILINESFGTIIQYQNGNIVSVPSDVQGAGTHNIVVETSSDLINWTPVHSSAISGGSEAFIRTRISTSE